MSQSQHTKPAATSAWTQLKTYTDARIGLGRSGVGQPIQANLDFKLAHAQARDAVKTTFRQQAMVEAIAEMHPSIPLESAAENRTMYLTRPDYGRKLSEDSEHKLKDTLAGKAYDIALVVGDGLSARAIHENAVPFIQRWNEFLPQSKLTVAPIPVVKNARVAIGDGIGQLCHAKIVLMLIGERPGLSSPDSMGIYITYQPRVGCTDERRNCISNVRSAGLPIEDAVRKTFYLLENALKRKVSGIELKDEMTSLYLPLSSHTQEC